MCINITASHICMNMTASNICVDIASSNVCMYDVPPARAPARPASVQNWLKWLTTIPGRHRSSVV